MVMRMAEQAAAVRQFNRFYTARIGVLRPWHVGQDFSLTEARVLYEIAVGGPLTAKVIAESLDLDPGYLSRMLKGFGGRGLVRRTPSEADRRQSLLELTVAGQTAWRALNAASQAETEMLLQPIPAADREAMVAAMDLIQSTLDGRGEDEIILRDPEPGDLGWIVERHGVLYAREQGWTGRMEGLVAEVVAEFSRSEHPDRQRCWIAVRKGQRVGCIFLMRHTDEVARLRLLLTEPSVRGLGLGKRLVAECIAFARACGYAKITLWTHDVLETAIGIYRKAGFHLVGEETHHHFGAAVNGQTWELPL